MQRIKHFKKASPLAVSIKLYVRWLTWLTIRPTRESSSIANLWFSASSSASRRPSHPLVLLRGRPPHPPWDLSPGRHRHRALRPPYRSRCSCCRNKSPPYGSAGSRTPEKTDRESDHDEDSPTLVVPYAKRRYPVIERNHVPGAHRQPRAQSHRAPRQAELDQ